MNFLDPTNFGYGGSSTGVLPTTLDSGINPGFLSQISSFLAARQVNGLPSVRLSSVIGVELYDTLRIDAGVLPQTTFNFFQNGINALQGLFVAGTQYRKQEIDVTQYVKGGILSKGYEALIWNIGVQFHTTSALDESVQTATGSSYVNLPLDPGTLTGEAAGDGIRQANLMRALQESLWFEFRINQTGFENGPGWRFPSGQYGIDGGIAMAGVQANPLADGALSNGLGGWGYQMPIMRYLPEQTPFTVDMTVQNPFTTANVGPLRVVVTLGGIILTPVTG